MDFAAAVKDQISLLLGGDPLEAFDRYFDDDGVMFDNDEPLGTGKVECREKQAKLIAKAVAITGKISDCSLDVENSICVFRNRSTFVDEAGDETMLDGIHWQRWAEGKIVEQRYYHGDAMTEKIGEGILEHGTVAIKTVPAPARAETKALRAAVMVALTELVSAEQVEIDAGAMGLVVDELLAAGLEANNPRHALKKLRIALINSERVEEVYADDFSIETAFRRAMGG